MKKNLLSASFLLISFCATAQPTCNIACYSHNPTGYHVGGDIFVQGIVEVDGHYRRGICLPAGYEHSDISAVQLFKDLCNNSIPECRENDEGCWAGGDTGTGGYYSK